MWSYLILGIVQGITEWLPISSQGVVAILARFTQIGINEIDVAIFLHLGTACAVLFYFRHEWLKIIKLENPVLLKFLIVTTIISLIIGFPLYHLIRLTTVGSALLFITGIGLLITAWLHRTRRKRGWSFDKLAYVVGLIQGLSVIPGFSRSGGTIFGLSLGKLNQTQILKISYLMSVPVVLASSSYLMLRTPALIYQGWPALITSFFFGVITLSLLLKLSQKINFFWWALAFAGLCFVGAIINFFAL